MFTCAKIRNGSTYLSKHLTANDYYCENESVVGRWVGHGAERLGLEGKAIGADDAAFEALRQNLMPDGSGRLAPPSMSKNAVRFFDFQCAPHKSVSIMAVVMDDKRLYKAHDMAAAKAFAELERFAAHRHGKSRQPKISGNICAAAFRHDASRSLDPQIHTHFVTVNATWDGRRWLALDTCEMFRAIRYAGKVYQNELAKECRRIGYSIESVRNDKGFIEGFQIAGVSEDIQERFSKRRTEVEAGMKRFQKEKGRMPNTREINLITRETRNVKLHEITTPEVRAGQRKQLSTDEIATLEAVKQNAIETARQRILCNAGLYIGSAWKALARASEHIYERKSVVHGHEILAESLNRHLGFLDLATLRRYMTSAYNGMIQLTRNLQNPLESSLWTSRRGLRLEQWAVAFVNQTQKTCNPLGETKNVSFSFKSDEQRNVVLQTLNNRDQVYAIRGCAGAGKTTCLSEIRKGLEAAGRTAIYLAPTSSAVEVLRNDGFTAATTVDSFLANDKKDLTGAVVIIDESSLQSNEMGAAVLNAAQNARVLFVGDTRQHVSVEAGDFLRVLEQRSNLRSSELTDIRRQQVKEYNAAVRTLSNGDAAGGMKQLDNLGWIHETEGEYIQDAADAYLDATAEGTNHDLCIAVSPTWNENHRFTDAIRQRMKERQLLDNGVNLTVCNQLDWTVEQKKTADNYKPGLFVTFNADKKSSLGGKTFEVDRIANGELWLKGHDKPVSAEKCAHKISVSLPRIIELSLGDKVLIRRNHHEAGLINGKVFTVNKINEDGSIETREGKNIPADYRHFCHGYVVTSYKSQGRTSENVIIAAETLDAKAAYVACSRGRQSANIFTPDKDNLFDNLGMPSDRLAATDVINKHREACKLEDEAEAFQYAVKDHLHFAAYQNFNINHTNDIQPDYQNFNANHTNDYQPEL